MKTDEDRFEELIKKFDAAINLVFLLIKEHKLPVLNSKEVMTKFDISRRKLYEYRTEDGLPYSQVKGRIYFEAAEILKWIRKKRKKIKKSRRKK